MRQNEARFCMFSATALNRATLFPNAHVGNLEQIRRTPSYCLAVCFRAWGLLCIAHLNLSKSLPGRIQRMLLLNRLAAFRRSDYMAHPIVLRGFSANCKASFAYPLEFIETRLGERAGQTRDMKLHSKRHRGSGPSMGHIHSQNEWCAVDCS